MKQPLTHFDSKFSDQTISGNEVVIMEEMTSSSRRGVDISTWGFESFTFHMIYIFITSNIDDMLHYQLTNYESIYIDRLKSTLL